MPKLYRKFNGKTFRQVNRKFRTKKLAKSFMKGRPVKNTRTIYSKTEKKWFVYWRR